PLVAPPDPLWVPPVPGLLVLPVPAEPAEPLKPLPPVAPVPAGGGVAVDQRSPVPTEKAPPPPAPAAWAGLGSTGRPWPDSLARGGCSRKPALECGWTTPGPLGAATAGGRDGSRSCRVTVPAATTMIVGIAVNATRTALISSGRRFGYN